ncbi:MAG: hypothetical protein AB7R69_02775 [Candidatus Babeliales bacterium]
MLAPRMLIFTLLLCFTHVFCSENIFQTLPPDVQHYIAQYLPFKGIESDNDLERIVTNSRILSNNLITDLNISEHIKIYYKLINKNLTITIKPQLISVTQDNQTNASFFSTSKPQELLSISLAKQPSKYELLPLIGSLVYTYNNLQGSDALVLKEIFDNEVIFSANNRYACIIQIKDQTPSYGIVDQCGFHVIDLKENTKKYIPLPKSFPARAIATDNTQYFISLIQEGYSSSPLHNQVVKFLKKSAISSDGTLIAAADTAGLYLFDISIYNNESYEPTWQQIKTFDAIKITNNPTNSIQQIEKIKKVEFNQQCTKLAVAYTQEGEQEMGVPVEIIALSGRREPQKTLADYCRENLICNNLNGIQENK